MYQIRRKVGYIDSLVFLFLFLPFFPVECNKERGLKFEESNAQSRVQKEQRNMESIVPVSLLHGHRMWCQRFWAEEKSVPIYNSGHPWSLRPSWPTFPTWILERSDPKLGPQILKRLMRTFLILFWPSAKSQMQSLWSLEKIWYAYCTRGVLAPRLIQRWNLWAEFHLICFRSCVLW